MKKADNFDSSKWLVENKVTFQSRLNENKIPGVNVEVDDDNVELSGDSGDYSGFIEDNGTVSFSVIYEDEDDRDGMEFDDENWKSILGDDHVFVKIANAINTDVEAMDDYVQITVKADDLTSMNESRLNENFEETHEYLQISPENFQPGDYFLRTPVYDNSGEFFDHKEKTKILSIDLPKDGRGNTSKVKTEDGKIMGLSSTSLYDIARPL